MFRAIYESSDDDDDTVQKPVRRYRPMIIHDNTKDFYERFRLYPAQFEKLMQLIGRRLEPIVPTNNAIEGKFKLLATLRFYGHNSDFSSLFDEQGPSKASISRFIRQTTIVLNDILRDYIKFPNSIAGFRDNALKFARITKFGLPNVVGAIDGTIVPIIGPDSTKFNQNAYFSRYLRYGISVLACCDADGKFQFVSARFPGKANDARVYNETLAQKFQIPFEGAYLLADSAYGASEKLIPMRPLAPDSPDLLKRFYASHAKSRVIIECVFGRWKSKFACLSRELRFTDPRICSTIIMATAYLYNFILETNEAEREEIIDDINRQNPFREDNPELEENLNLPEGPQDARERRRKGQELLNKTLEKFKEMHGFE